jgi:hypothetical protein
MSSEEANLLDLDYAATLRWPHLISYKNVSNKVEQNHKSSIIQDALSSVSANKINLYYAATRLFPSIVL